LNLIMKSCARYSYLSSNETFTAKLFVVIISFRSFLWSQYSQSNYVFHFCQADLIYLMHKNKINILIL